GKFQARESEEGPLLDATDPQAAYRWAIGQANQSPTLDRAFLPAIDGAIHTYRAAGGALGGVPLSVDTLRAMQLVDPATDQLYLSSDRAMEDRLNDPRIAASELEFGDLRTLLGGVWNADTGQFRGDYPPSGMFSQVQAKVGDWKARRGLQSEQAGRENLVRNCTQKLDHGTTEAPLAEGLRRCRHHLPLANPTIVAPSITDNSVRGGNIALSQLVTGESSGAIPRLLAQARGDQAKVT